jgi:ribulose-5-phosphate 4-epimerase/fuculose-1-phosphate aldolase
MAALLADHGNVTVGSDLYSAFYLAQYLEDACRMAVIVQQLKK